MVHGSSSCWVVCLRPVAAPRIRLFCFPHGGGSAATFKDWPTQLAQDVEVCAIQLPGHGTRLLEPPAVRMADIIATLVEESRPYLGTPSAIFGHSLGALIAFEFARQLRSIDMSPVHLFVSGQTAPQLPGLEAPIHGLPDRDFIAELQRRYEGLPKEILCDEEMLAVLLPALRADFTVKETYRYIEVPLLECPISAFGGQQDGSVPVDGLAAWRDQTCCAFSFRMFPGGHFFIDSAQKSVLKSVATDLEHSLRGGFCENGATVMSAHKYRNQRVG